MTQNGAFPPGGNSYFEDRGGANLTSYPAMPYQQSDAGYPAAGAGYPSGYPYPGSVYAPPPANSGFAIASLVLALVGGSVLAVIFGHVALSQIRRNNAGGRGMAIAGLIIGYLGIAAKVGFLLLLVLLEATSFGYG